MDAFFLYRLSHWLYKCHVPLFPKVIQLVIFFMFSSYIPYQIIMGRNCKIGHRGIGVVINKDSVLGDNVLVRAHVTIGKKYPGGGAPVIGNNVVLGDGCKVLGEITIGDNAVIGANSVVVKDVNHGDIVGGVPARVIGHVSNV